VSGGAARDDASGPLDASGEPLVSATIDCIDCGGVAHLITRVDDTGRFWPGDLVTYRCEDCLDRWDLIVPGEESKAGDGDE
jgi:hypothetical protein